ncbi:penicillin-binding protein [Corynebacterium phocae]|uniref:Penicillin-binding protein n=1 Tax=Corynebacterium phocae TaxID=161895 RepID=A0A1L7D0R8_9CORY|nr:transglycosylase domain-containing protein [Corynebacterium phocae]APT91746.1 penicillin-binding protein [Corynebacterium phocae]KAA8728550.1 penicillin-binding protein [Corynebacterium phocae]
MFLATVLVGVLCALVIAPIAGLGGIAVAKTNEAMRSDIDNIETDNTPGVSVIKDAAGNELAYLYDQRRHPVNGEDISQYVKDAIVSIEDRRFYEHDGVDIQGNARAVVTNLLKGGVSQGASTLNQQYVKNYLLLVEADNEQDRQAATEQSVARKLREVRLATRIDRRLSKEDILTNYLNLVPFGNHAYGIEAAARTYFGIPARNLNLSQSAMLAGMVQSSEYLNPYTNYDVVRERRNVVLQSMVANGYISQIEADQAAATELGVLEKPSLLSNGCIAAGDRGFFCDYVVQYLEGKGLSAAELTHGGYTVNTTLDPQVQDAAKAAVVAQVNPQQPGVAEVMSVIEPLPDARPVRAMVSSRTYGLDLDNFETILPQPYSLVGHGAGSVFKVFTAAAAIDAGYGIKNQIAVPARYEAEGLGHGGAKDCPPTKYCVENAGSYQASMTLADTLAHSPNTAFIALLEQVGVPAVVDMAVKLGLRSYAEKGTFDGTASIAQYAKDSSMGAFTLGPTAVNPLELSNVGATLGAGGRWCEPNPIVNVTDKLGNKVFIDTPPCEQVLDLQVADALSNALQADVITGTAADAARATGFHAPVAAKTGTTEEHQSAAFLGYNSTLAAAPYIYNDGTTTTPICTAPVRQCEFGDIYGGMEPARTYLSMAAGSELFNRGNTPPYAPKFDQGTSGFAFLDALRGKSQAVATKTLEDEGYKVKVNKVPAPGVGFGQVVRALKPAGRLKEGMEITVQVSDGSGYVAPAPNRVRNSTPPAQAFAPQPQAPAPAANPDAELENAIADLANQIRQDFGL